MTRNRFATREQWVKIVDGDTLVAFVSRNDRYRRPWTVTARDGVERFALRREAREFLEQRGYRSPSGDATPEFLPVRLPKRGGAA